MAPMQKARAGLPLQAKPASVASMEVHQPSGRHAVAYNQEGQTSARLDPLVMLAGGHTTQGGKLKWFKPGRLWAPFGCTLTYNSFILSESGRRPHQPAHGARWSS